MTSFAYQLKSFWITFTFFNFNIKLRDARCHTDIPSSIRRSSRGSSTWNSIHQVLHVDRHPVVSICRRISGSWRILGPRVESARSRTNLISSVSRVLNPSVRIFVCKPLDVSASEILGCSREENGAAKLNLNLFPLQYSAIFFFSFFKSGEASSIQIFSLPAVFCNLSFSPSKV